ncbi:nuclear receptor 2c2-associated [Moniliophthora roreri MCA 2997]|uniref:Nuclear receptor 2c2-associated n=2 Tax=Moniliophthora roreri TaxID=221103 RepID=V2XUH4_MONRO|nr:nuclear receptor 2c2-associated [Moniliophthora roreri MCA 2997]KAI3622336.1 nuclear receptor 2c2-associated [Moniliophthora roreri]
MAFSDIVSLLTPETTIKVSSTLDKSVGKKHLIDNNPETCWTSQQGLPQYIQLAFPAPVIPKIISITFQGGFVGRRCTIQVKEAAGWKFLTNIYPEDVNRRQTFDLSGAPDTGVDGLKLTFEESSDFFGRITVYDLKLEGSVSI